jgi:hypothetical protein
LTILSRDQAENMAAEIDALRAASAKMCARSLAAIDIMSSSSRVWDSAESGLTVAAAGLKPHREIVEKLDAEIMSLRRANDELTILSRDQAENMAELLDDFAVRPLLGSHRHHELVEPRLGLC